MREVVPAVDAARIAAQEKEERGRGVDHDVPDVLRARRPALLLDLEAQADEVGRFGAEAASLGLALTALRETLRRRVVSAKIHDDPLAIILED